MTNQKITDEQLKKEIKKGKTEKEIAYDNGYGYPSSALNRRLNELGFDKNSKLTQQGAGGATSYWGKNIYHRLARQKEFNPNEDTLFLKISEHEDSGKAVVEITDKAFRKTE